MARYDGHGGSSTAEFVTKQLGDHILARVAKLPHKQGLLFANEDAKRALQQGYADTDAAVQRKVCVCALF